MADKDVPFAPQYFGIVIAFLLPGFLGLWLISHYDATAAAWLGVAATKETTVGAFLFASAGSLGLGIILSGLRWLILEASGLEGLMGVPPRRDVDQQKRKEYEATLEEITENHYKFYLFYANTAVAFLLAIPLLWAQMNWPAIVGMLILETVLIASARDAIIRVRRKTENLLGLYVPPTQRKVG